MKIKTHVLISIKPEYAEMLFDGTKKVELRRTCPKIERGDYLVVYASSPVKALLGRMKVERIISNTPKKLWPQVNRHAGISKGLFDSYYKGIGKGFAIFISKIERLEDPLHLRQIRRKWRNFTPPQSYRYLTDHQLDSKLAFVTK